MNLSNGMGLNNGIKQIINNVSSKEVKQGSNAYVEYKTYSNYKLLKDLWHIEGKVKLTLKTAPTAKTAYTIEYKADHFYRLFTSILLRLNANISVKQLNDLSFMKFYQVFENIGDLPFCDVPTAFEVNANQTEVTLPFKFLVPFWFIAPDMIGATQSFIFLEIYNSMQTSFEVGYYKDIVSNIQDAKGTSLFSYQDLTNGTEPKVTFELDSMNVRSASEFWIVNNDYLKVGSAKEALAKLGSLYVTKHYSQTFKGNGEGQYIKLTPTTQETLKDLTIVARDSVTGKRVDDVIKRIRVANGDRALVDCEPIFLRENNLERYNLSWDLYNEFDATQPDNQGKLYGVDRIDTTYFGEIGNAILATGDWQQPMLFLDFQNMNKLEGELLIDVYQSSFQVPQAIQSAINKYVQASGVSQ